MANHRHRVPNNVPGPFFVDTSCIDCNLCHHAAPDHFDRIDGEGCAYVKKQPENDMELQRCREAMNDCPVEAIGDHGLCSS